MPPLLIAHRGDRGRYPENTLAALAGAVAVGAGFVEFDIQFSTDAVPMLCHDADLERLAGKSGRIMDFSAADLKRLPLRGSDGSGIERIPALSEAVALLSNKVEVFSFVELKRESLEHFGRGPCLAGVLGELAGLGERWALISFDLEVLIMAKAGGLNRVGWVLDTCDASRRGEAEDLEPQYLFCDRKKLRFRRRPPWPGPWRWAVYAVNRASSALSWGRRGFDFVETDRIAELMRDPRLHPIEESGGD